MLADCLMFGSFAAAVLLWRGRVAGRDEAVSESHATPRPTPSVPTADRLATFSLARRAPAGTHPSRLWPGDCVFSTPDGCWVVCDPSGGLTYLYHSRVRMHKGGQLSVEGVVGGAGGGPAWELEWGVWTLAEGCGRGAA